MVSVATSMHSGRRRWRPTQTSDLFVVALSDVSHIIYGPYTDTFARKTAHDRTDSRWCCFSLVLRESRTVSQIIDTHKYVYTHAHTRDCCFSPWVLMSSLVCVSCSGMLSIR